jgi:hypothetical protein
LIFDKEFSLRSRLSIGFFSIIIKLGFLIEYLILIKNEENQRIAPIIGSFI